MSIWSSQNVVVKGTHWRVGDVQSISIWNDHWLRDQDNPMIEKTRIPSLKDMRVSDLMRTQRWNVDLINNIFSDWDTHQILNILVMHLKGQDMRI